MPNNTIPSCSAWESRRSSCGVPALDIPGNPYRVAQWHILSIYEHPFWRSNQRAREGMGGFRIRESNHTDPVFWISGRVGDLPGVICDKAWNPSLSEAIEGDGLICRTLFYNPVRHSFDGSWAVLFSSSPTQSYPAALISPEPSERAALRTW